MGFPMPVKHVVGLHVFWISLHDKSAKAQENASYAAFSKNISNVGLEKHQVSIFNPNLCFWCQC